MSADLSPYALDPFGPSADPGAYVACEASERARAALERSLDRGRVGAVVGPPGYGKTLLLRLLGGREEDRSRVAYVPFPSLDVDELFALVLNALGARRKGPPREALLALTRELAPRGGVVILVDDANDLSDASANALASLITESGGALRIGLAAVEGPDARRVLRAFGSRVDVVHLTDGLTERESRRYVETRLAYGGARPELVAAFDEFTIARLHRSSQGVPRRLNQVAQDVVRRAVPTALPRLRDLSFELEVDPEPASAAEPAAPKAGAPADAGARDEPARDPFAETAIDFDRAAPQPIAAAPPTLRVAPEPVAEAPPPALRPAPFPSPEPVAPAVVTPIGAREEPTDREGATDREEPTYRDEPAYDEDAAYREEPTYREEPFLRDEPDLDEDLGDVAPEEPAPSETVPWFRPLRRPFPSPHQSRRPSASVADPSPPAQPPAAAAPPAPPRAAPPWPTPPQPPAVRESAPPQTRIEAPAASAPPPPRPTPAPPPAAAAPRPAPPAPSEPPAPELQDEEGILLARPAPLDPAGEYRYVRGRRIEPEPPPAPAPAARPAARHPHPTHAARPLPPPDLPAASNAPRMGRVGLMGFGIGVLVALLFTLSPDLESRRWMDWGGAPWRRSIPRVPTAPPAPAPAAPSTPEPVAATEPPAQPTPHSEEAVAAQVPAPEPAAPVAPAPAAEPQPVAETPIATTAATPAASPAPAPTPATPPAPAPPAAAPAPIVAISINATPWAIVSVDGRELGETPLAGVQLTVGPHVFTARMPDGSTREQRIEIAPGRDTVVFE